MMCNSLWEASTWSNIERMMHGIWKHNATERDIKSSHRIYRERLTMTDCITNCKMITWSKERNEDLLTTDDDHNRNPPPVITTEQVMCLEPVSNRSISEPACALICHIAGHQVYVCNPGEYCQCQTPSLRINV
ncbi:hypothetical protein QAD02_024067 [Eretmocerus hayati]|uniref:Uncharacterized protein n=1 Tax=Eretmocerus hayati TaxID=131215 RepID=A0ACC2Q132_9HYME|nr:hypothetical protein QAD02_024067 [Eretmocerus hayati]